VRRLGKWIRSILFLPLRGGKRLYFLTAAEALASTEKRIRAGDFCFVLDQGGKVVEAQTPGPASTTWAQRVTEIVRGDTSTIGGAGALRYWIANSTSIASSIGSSSRLLCTYPGEVRKYVWRMAVEMAAGTLTVHKNLNTTPIDSVAFDPVVGTIYTWEPTASTFVVGDLMTFGMTCPTDPGATLIEIEIEWLVPLAA